jgi:hypothetical protein
MPLLTIFIIFAVALAGVGASFFTNYLIDSGLRLLGLGLFFIAALPLMWAALTLLEVLIHLAADLPAYGVHHMNQRIAITEGANNGKAKDIGRAFGRRHVHRAPSPVPRSFAIDQIVLSRNYPVTKSLKRLVAGGGLEPPTPAL